MSNEGTKSNKKLQVRIVTGKIEKNLRHHKSPHHSPERDRDRRKILKERERERGS